MTFDEHHRYADENYAKVTTNRLKKSFRALARTLQTRGLDILLRALAEGRTVLKPPQRRNNAKPASEKSPASLSPLQSPRPASLGEKSRAISSAYMASKRYHPLWTSRHRRLRGPLYWCSWNQGSYHCAHDVTPSIEQWLPPSAMLREV